MTLTIRSLSSILCLLVAGALALVLAPSGQASPRLQVGIMDDAQIMHPDDRDAGQGIRRPCGAAPRGASRPSPVGPGGADPAGRDPRNPDSTRISGPPTTRSSARRRRRTSRSLFNIFGTPAWANGGRLVRLRAASATTLKDFAYAAAKRYSGSFAPTASTVRAAQGGQVDCLERAEPLVLAPPALLQASPPPPGPRRRVRAHLQRRSRRRPRGGSELPHERARRLRRDGADREGEEVLAPARSPSCARSRPRAPGSTSTPTTRTRAARRRHRTHGRGRRARSPWGTSTCS